MFERFGNFDSAEEINQTAAGLKEEGDLESLKVLAKENGLDEYDAEDYMNGDITELCNPLSAAVGKLKVERDEAKPELIMKDWMEHIMKQTQKLESFRKAVRRKDKSLTGCFAAVLIWSFEHQIKISQEIIKEAKIKAGRVTIGIPNKETAEKIIDEYYGGGK